MREVVITIAGLCMTAALCSRFMDRNRFFNSIRFMLGLLILQAILDVSAKLR